MCRPKFRRLLALRWLLPLFTVCAGLLGACSSNVNNVFQSTGTTGTFTAISPPTNASEQQGSSYSTTSVASSGSSQRSSSKNVQELAASYSAVSTPGNIGYKIGPQDVLEINVFKVPDLSKTVPVSENGTINLPLVGEVHAAGKTAHELEGVLTELLGAKYLQSPQVNVNVKDYNSQRITVEGAVKTPGVYPIRGQNSLLQTIAQSGGFTENADTTVVIFRQNGGKKTVGRFDVSEIKQGAAQDPPLQAGDIVIVGTSAMKESWNAFLKTIPMMGAFALLL